MSFKIIKDLIYEGQELKLGNELYEWMGLRNPMTKEEVIKEWTDYEYIDKEVGEKAFSILEKKYFLYKHENLYYVNSKKHGKLLKNLLDDQRKV